MQLKKTDFTEMSLDHIKKLSVSLLAVFVVSCVDLSPEEDSDNLSPNDEPKQIQNKGGSAGDPADLDLGMNNEINENQFFNYFSYTAQAGEKIIIGTTLNTPLTLSQKNTCSFIGNNGSSGDTGASIGKTDAEIGVYDPGLSVVGGLCGDNLTYSFIQDGEYIFHLKFENNGGYFNAFTTRSTQSSGSGSPSDPKTLSLTLNNEINLNSFYNYYSYNALAGEKIIVSASLDIPITDSEDNSCGYVSYEEIHGESIGFYDNEIGLYDTDFNVVGGKCGDEITHTFEHDGTYILHLNFSSGIRSGYFNVASIQ